MRDLENIEAEVLKDNLFTTAVSSLQHIPSSIGRWRAYREGPYTDSIERPRVELPLGECTENFKKKTESYLSKRFDQSIYLPYKDNALCIQDLSSAFISGTISDSNFVEIVYEFEHCGITATSVDCDSEVDKLHFWALNKIDPVLLVMQNTVKIHDEEEDMLREIVTVISHKGNTESFQQEVIIAVEKNEI